MNQQECAKMTEQIIETGAEQRQHNHSRLKDIIIGSVFAGMVLFGAGKMIYDFSRQKEVNPIYWSINTVGGIGCLYYVHQMGKRDKLNAELKDENYDVGGDD